MELILPLEITKKLRKALSDAGAREIGGVLMGEHLAEDRFQVKDITIQYHGGSIATFLRAVQGMVGQLRQFFRATSHDYTRFNYLGEWHSHPSFPPIPSSTDHATMRDIIDDPDVGAHFVVLVIVRLANADLLEGSVTVYQPGGHLYAGQLLLEQP